MRLLYPSINEKVGVEGVSVSALLSLAAAVGVLVWWLQLFVGFGEPRANQYSLTLTLTQPVVAGVTQVATGAIYRFGLGETMTPTSGAVETSTPTLTPTPSPTINAWATEYWAAEQTRAAYFTDRGVLAPAVDCSLGLCTPATVPAATLPPSPTRVWYNTPEPDFTPAIVQTQIMDMTLQPLMQQMIAAATQAAERSGERFSETRVPHAQQSPER